MSTLIHPLQHISGKDHDRRLRRSWRHCQHWRFSEFATKSEKWNRKPRLASNIAWHSPLKTPVSALRHQWMHCLGYARVKGNGRVDRLVGVATITSGLCLRRSAVLALFVPSNSEWVASSSPSNIGAKRSKVGVGQEKPDESAHILTVNIAVLPSLSDTISFFFSGIYSGSSTHTSPSHQLYARCHHPWKVYILCFNFLD